MKLCRRVIMLDFFFNPDGVAILGASSNKLKTGYHIVKNLLAGYKGKIYPVNPNYEEILGLPCYPDVESIPGNFDCAIYFIPSRHLPDSILSCARKGVKGIIIESGGFTEAGPEGELIQKNALENAAKTGIRLWGPNCMGYIDANARHVFSFLHSAVWPDILKPGNVGLIVQSGMLSAGFLLSALQEGVMGVSKACSIGNKCDINENDILEFFTRDEETGVIACYLESLIDGRAFMDIARKTPKPVIVLSGGRSAHGARAAMSHTASLSGNYSVTHGAFQQAGIIEAYDPAELTDMSRAFSKIHSCPQAGGVAILTFSGGAGTITTDLLDDYHMPLAQLSENTLSEIGALFPAWIKPTHPLDLWSSIEQKGYKEVYLTCLKALLSDPAVDSILYQSYTSLEIDPSYFVAVAGLMREYGKPIILWVEGRKELVEKIRTMAEEAGIPAFRDLTRCVSVLAGLRRHFQKKR
jgi:acyl-CoA synthetase (NDP forming)